MNNYEVIINMTPHEIKIVRPSGDALIFSPCGQTIRLTTKTVQVGGLFNGIPLTKTVFGEPERLPEYSEGTYYIVSSLVKQALPDRKDLLVPNESVRDEQGRIIGCKSFGV